MWGYVSGTIFAPTDKTDSAKYAELMDTWEANNSKIITWINNSVVQSIGVQLAKYTTAKEIWEHLEKLFVQSNFAKQYQLEIDIRAIKQKNMSIQEFYSAMTDIWDQLALTESPELRAFQPYIARREEQRLVQFLMALRDDFEGIRGAILYRKPLPSVDSVVNELMAEETRLKTQTEKGNMEKGILPNPSTYPSIFAAFPRPFSINQNKSHGRLENDECNFCKQKGHWKAQCPKLLNRTQPQFRPPQMYQRNFRPLNTAALVPSTNSSILGHTNHSEVPSSSTLAEQFKRFLAT